MDDQPRQVQEEISETKEKLTRAEIEATKADLTEAGRQRNLDLVLALTNLLVRLYDKEARVEARLSAGEIYYNRGVCDILRFLPPPHVHDIILPNIYIYVSPS
jgi:predicted S18 family serine protease